MIQKVILLLLLSLVAVNGQTLSASPMSLSITGTVSITTSITGTVSITVSNSFSNSVSNSVSITTSNTNSVSITTSWSTSTSVSISLSNSLSGSGTPSPTPSVTPSFSPTNSVNFRCGDGVITTSLNEQCDFGSDNILGSECCNEFCQWKHVGARCANTAASVCVAKGRCYNNPDKSIKTGNFARLCVKTRNQPNGSGCPVSVNGTITKGFCIDGVCKAGRRFR